MNRYAYRVYYAFYGATKCDPFRSEKDADQILKALKDFEHDLTHYLSDDLENEVESTATAEIPNSIDVLINTKLSEEATDAGVKRCLNALDLFAEKGKVT